MSGKHDTSTDMPYAPMLNPKWAALFFFGGGAVLIVLGVLVWLLSGFSAASDRVFAMEALVSGLSVIGFIRFRLHRLPILEPIMKIPFVYVWLTLCAYVFFLTPFE